jgi:hypothetical protein
MSKPHDPTAAYRRALEEDPELLKKVKTAHAADFQDGAIGIEDIPNSPVEKQADALLRLAAEAELFNDNEGQPFATIPVNGHHETWFLNSRTFKTWLQRRHYEEKKSAVSPQAFQAALGVLEAKARFESPCFPTNLRVGGSDEKLYIDLGLAAWNAVEITMDGWKVIAEPPVKFRRARGMRPLPIPVKEGNIEELRRFLNPGISKENWMLLVSWVLGSLRPSGPYPVLALYGEHGSAKSASARALRSLIDPNSAPLRTEPRDARDLMIAALNSWVICFDNISHLPQWLSDILCRIATGGGFGTRQLYTDQDEILFEAQRPVILNGIEEMVAREDLLDRALIVDLPPISERKRVSERDFWSRFQGASPRILGALLDIASAGLRSLPNIAFENLPRMADFAIWASACEQAAGWRRGEFVSAYSSNQAAANAFALEGSCLAVAILSVMATMDSLEDTAAGLLKTLSEVVGEEIRRQRNWPKSPRALANEIRRLAPILRVHGIAVDFSRESTTARRRLIKLWNVASNESEASESSDSQVGEPAPDWVSLDDLDGNSPTSSADGTPTGEDEW